MSAIPAPVLPHPSTRDRRLLPVPPALPTLPAAEKLPGLSAIVTTFNEEDTIAECLESLVWCDEILVVDSYSTDDTVAIARRYDKVRVVQRTYYGAASQKNWAIDRVRHNWILILDADERVSPELRREIEERLASPPTASAFAINRRTYALGSVVRYSGWQHDRVIRLFHGDAARYPNRRVHADMMTLQPPAVLHAPLDHYMVDDLGEYVRRIQRYAYWGAAQLWRDDRRAGPWEVFVRPWWRFLRTYLLQLGCIEGTRGFVMCALQAYGVFLKYTTLWSWQADRRKGQNPDLPAFDDAETTWAWPEHL